MRVVGTVAVLLVVACMPCRAELIDGPTNLRTAPGGEVVASLKDKSHVSIDGVQGNGYWIRVTCFIPNLTGKLYADFPSSIPKGTILYDYDGNKIGKALDNIDVSDGPDQTVKMFNITFQAFTYKNNIRPESLIEQVIEDLIVKKHNLNIRSTAWQTYLKSNRYSTWMDKRPFRSYLVYVNYYDAPQGMPRIILFTHAGTVFAILHHKPLSLGPGLLQDKVAGFKIDILYHANPALIRKFRAIYYPILRVAN